MRRDEDREHVYRVRCRVLLGQTGLRIRNVSMSTSRLRINLRGMEMRAGSGDAVSI